MCKFSYEIKGCDYLLCKCLPKPDPANKNEVFHAVCPHQTFCQTAGCNRMTEGWVDCYNRNMNAKADNPMEVNAKEKKPPSRTTRKTKPTAE